MIDDEVDTIINVGTVIPIELDTNLSINTIESANKIIFFLLIYYENKGKFNLLGYFDDVLRISGGCIPKILGVQLV